MRDDSRVFLSEICSRSDTISRLGDAYRCCRDKMRRPPSCVTIASNVPLCCCHADRHTPQPALFDGQSRSTLRTPVTSGGHGGHGGTAPSTPPAASSPSTTRMSAQPSFLQQKVAPFSTSKSVACILTKSRLFCCVLCAHACAACWWFGRADRRRWPRARTHFLLVTDVSTSRHHFSIGFTNRYWVAVTLLLTLNHRLPLCGATRSTASSARIVRTTAT